MKFCDLTQFYSPVSGGVRRYLEQKVAYLREHCPGDEHILIVPGEKTECVGDDRARVYTIASPLVSRTSRYRALLRLSRVEEVLEREKPHLIESGDPYQVAWKAIASGRALGIPAVGFYHSHFPEATIRSVSKFFGRTATDIAQEAARRYIRALYNKFERTLVPSPALATLLTDWGVENIAHTDLGVDVNLFAPEGRDDPALRARLALPADRTLLLYVGRLAPEKNVRTLFAAFEALHAREPERFHLLVVGDGTRRAELERAREVTGQVTWLPRCGGGDELAACYRAADLFVHPGVLETFGLVTIEAQASGLPVVGIRGSYMDRIVFTTQAHWAAENTPAALAEAIDAATRTDLRAAGLAASRTVRERFAWPMIFDRLFAIYRTVIAEYKT